MLGLCGLVPPRVLGKFHDNIIIFSDEKKLCEKGMVCFAPDCGAQQRTVPQTLNYPSIILVCPHLVEI